jgi:hypothetical protein
MRHVRRIAWLDVCDPLIVNVSHYLGGRKSTKTTINKRSVVRITFIRTYAMEKVHICDEIALEHI